MSLEIKDLDDDCWEVTLASAAKLILKVESHDVTVYAKNDEEVGKFSFREITVPGYPNDETQFVLTHAFLEGHGGIYKGQGVGTEAVRLFKAFTGDEIIFSDNDGQTRSDGSHYVDDGWGFVQHLQKLIARGEL